MTGAPKQCADLIQANLAGGALVTITALAEGSNRYTIKRGLKQNPVLLTSDGRADQYRRSRSRHVSAAGRLQQPRDRGHRGRSPRRQTPESAGRTSQRADADHPLVAGREHPRAGDECGSHQDLATNHRRPDRADRGTRRRPRPAECSRAVRSGIFGGFRPAFAPAAVQPARDREIGRRGSGSEDAGANSRAIANRSAGCVRGAPGGGAVRECGHAAQV